MSSFLKTTLTVLVAGGAAMLGVAVLRKGTTATAAAPLPATAAPRPNPSVALPGTDTRVSLQDVQSVASTAKQIIDIANSLPSWSGGNSDTSDYSPPDGSYYDASGLVDNTSPDSSYVGGGSDYFSGADGFA